MTPRTIKQAVFGGAAVAATATALWIASTPRPAPTPAPSAPPPPVEPPSAAPKAPAEPANGAAITPEVTTIKGDDAFRLQVFTFAVAEARFRVIDLGMTKDLAGTRAKTGASLVINGGFFDKSEQPEGLVISEGKQLSAQSDALGGGVLAVTGGRAALHPAEAYAPGADVSFAVQARPRLVADDKRVIVRDDGKTAERTALCVRDGGRTMEVVIARGDQPGQGPTLAFLADMLLSRGCQAALNLDGGPSTGAAWRDPGGAQELPARGPLRHAIAIWIGS